MELDNHVEQLKNALDNANAEKLALDQMLVDNIQKMLAVKKELIMINQQVQKLLQENADLKAPAAPVELKAMPDLVNPDLVDPVLNEARN